MAIFVSPDSGREVEVAPGERQERMLRAGWKRKDGKAPEPEPHAPDPTTDAPLPDEPATPARPKKTTAAKAKSPEPLMQAGPAPDNEDKK